MVKSPDLLRGLLDKKVDRCKMLKIAGFTGALAALAACSGGKYSAENKPASPSTANIPMGTADSRTTPPSTSEATPTPEVEAPIDPSEIIPEDTLHERLALPNFKELKSGHRWESDAGQDVVKKLIDAINCLVCPTLLNEGTDRVFGQYATKEGSSSSLSHSICDYVREQFVETTMSPGAPSKEKTPEFLAWVKSQCCDNVEIAIRGNVGEDRSDYDAVPLKEGREFYKKYEAIPRADGDLAEFSITPHDNSLYLKWNARARTNLDPSDPRYADIENERQRFEAYLKQEKDGALSISKISVEESTKQS